MTPHTPATGGAALRALPPTARTDPEKPAVVCDSGEFLTYGELADRASRLAGELRRRALPRRGQAGDDRP